MRVTVTIESYGIGYSMDDKVRCKGKRAFNSLKKSAPVHSMRLALKKVNKKERKRRKKCIHIGYKTLTEFPLYHSRRKALKHKKGRNSRKLDRENNSEEKTPMENKTLPEFLNLPELLHEECLNWIRSTWDIDWRIKTITVNSALHFNECPVHQKFTNALSNHSIEVSTGSYM